MKPNPPRYRCRTCTNVSVTPEQCHGQPMGEVCFCGTGKLLENCHKAHQQSSQQLQPRSQ